MSGNNATTYTLLIWLLGVVTTIVILSGIVNYTIFTTELKRDLQRQADEASERVSALIALDLWNLNTRTITEITREQLTSAGISEIRVYDNFGELIVHIGGKMSEGSYTTNQSNVFYQGELAGSVELSLSQHNIEVAQWAIIRSVAIGVLLMVLSISLTTYILMRSLVTQPLNALMEGLKSVTSGNFDNPIPSFRRSDMNFISNAFNTMRTELKLSRTKLVDLNKNLEHKVAERTAELESKNDELQKINGFMINRELKMIDLKKQLRVMGEKLQE